MSRQSGTIKSYDDKSLSSDHNDSQDGSEDVRNSVASSKCLVP